MANGHPMNPSAPVVAHRSLPLGTRLRLHLAGRSVEAVVADRGPFVRGRDMDVSKGIAVALGFIGQGTATIEVEVL